MPDVRLIDANALINVLCEILRSIDNGRTMRQAAISVADRMRIMELEYCIGLIQCADIIDAVPVVRCRECEKFWEYTESHKATVEKADGDCMIRCMVAPDDPQFCAVQKDDYCSMGKRKGAKKDGGADNG